MSFNFEFYLQLAEELISQMRNPDLKEAYLRSSASRSYYSVYLIASNCYEKKHGSIKRKKNQGPHRSLYLAYIRSSNETEKQIGYNLNRLWDQRKDADYKPKADFDLNRAKMSILWAKQILQQLKSGRYS